jgi:hypothetical protein
MAADWLWCAKIRVTYLPHGKVLQLWALPKAGAAFPLGVVPSEGKRSVHMADTSEKLLPGVPRLPVSVEDTPRRARGQRPRLTRSPVTAPSVGSPSPPTRAEKNLRRACLRSGESVRISIQDAQ